MRTSQILTYFVLTFLCFNLSNAQEKFISSFSPGIYKKYVKSPLEDAIDTDNHKTLLTAFKSTDLEHLIDEKVPFTIFAPSDKAFLKFTQSKLNELLNPENKKQLESVLKYLSLIHI